MKHVLLILKLRWMLFKNSLRSKSGCAELVSAILLGLLLVPLDLALSALKRTRSAARLKIAGTGPQEKELRKQIARDGLEDRVELLGFVPGETLVDLYAGCRAAYYAPFDEDYGYVTVESFLSRKPVVTTSDAGGPLEFVTEGENGWVAAPRPDAIADAIDSLWNFSPARLRDMGEAGRRRVEGINWDQVIDHLTADLR